MTRLFIYDQEPASKTVVEDCVIPHHASRAYSDLRFRFGQRRDKTDNTLSYT